MSVQATTWVWEYAESTGNELLVLLAIADAANREGENSCQSLPTLAGMARVGRSTAARHVAELKDRGLIEKTGVHGRYKTSIYRLPHMATRPGSETSQIGTGPAAETPPVPPVRPNPKELTPEQETSNSGEVELGAPVNGIAPFQHPARAIDPHWTPRRVFAQYLADRYRHVTIAEALTRFRNHQLARQATSRSWEALFENWVSSDEQRTVAMLYSGTDDRGIPVTQSGKSIVPPPLQPGDEGYFNPHDPVSD